MLVDNDKHPTMSTTTSRTD